MLRTIYAQKFQLLEIYTQQLNKWLKKRKFQTLTLSRRQRIINRIERLQKSLALLSNHQPMKRVLVAASITLGLAISPVSAQQNFQFKPKQVNPFGLTPTTPDWTMQAMADLDGDGDLDLMASGSDGNFVYHQNTGTAKSPSFSAGVTSPFGLPAGVGDFREPTFVDLDGDGDLDMVVAEYSGTFFYQNTGTNLAPTFTTPVLEPFGLVTPGYNTLSVDFADMDKDGDLDAFMINRDLTTVLNYFENTGSPTNPTFSNRQTNPFGLQIATFSLFLEVADMDNDGDFDLAIAVSYFGNIIYYENVGTQNLPNFLPLAVNPFGIDVEDIYTNFVHPTLIDIDNDGDLDLFAGENSFTTRAGNAIINYQECNTAPTSRDSMATTVKNVDLLFSKTAFPFSDPDDTALVAIKIVSLPTKGILKLFGNAVRKDDIIPALSIMNLTFSSETDSFKVDGTAYTTFDFRVMDQSMIGSSTNTFSIFVEPPIFDQPTLALSPNPATNYLQIEINGLELHKTVALSILDVSGKLVYQEMVNSSELYNKTIATSELANGLYFIIIETEQGLLRERFIKN